MAFPPLLSQESQPTIGQRLWDLEFTSSAAGSENRFFVDFPREAFPAGLNLEIKMRNLPLVLSIFSSGLWLFASQLLDQAEHKVQTGMR